jgi:hypothetical protein
LSTKKDLQVDLVVLAIPLSDELLANVFLELGVKHVVAFNFDLYVQYSSLIGKVQETIFKFCIQFYTQLLTGKMKVKQAFENIMSRFVFEDREFIHTIYANNEMIKGKLLKIKS